MEEHNIDILTRQFACTPGFCLLPKTDGRVEVPQSVISKLGVQWKRNAFIYVYTLPESLVLTYIEKPLGTLVGKIKVSKGRVRIPTSFLRKIGIDNRPLIASISGENDLFVRGNSYDNIEQIEEVINEIDSSIVSKLVELVKGKKSNRTIEINTDYCVSDEIEKNFVFSNPVTPGYKKCFYSFKRNDPMLFMPEIDSPVKFRPIRPPSVFDGFWLNTNELVIDDYDLSISNEKTRFFLIAGTKRFKNTINPGYLLVGEQLFGKIRMVLDTSNYKKRDLIIWHDPFTMSSFKAYIDPIEEMSDDAVKYIDNICGAPNQFVKRCFRQITKQDIRNITRCPITLSDRHIGVMRDG